LAALEAGASEASVRSPTGKGKQIEALSNDLLDPNHPKNIGQQFDDSENSVHTDKASSLTRAHRYYQTKQYNNTATAGSSKQNTTAPKQQQQDENEIRDSKGPVSSNINNNNNISNTVHTAINNNNNMPAHMPLLGNETSKDNSKPPALLDPMVFRVTMGPPHMDFLTHIGTPNDHMPVDPRIIMAVPIYMDNKAIPAMMTPVDPRIIMVVPIYLDNKTIPAMMALLDHGAIPETLPPPMASNHRITNPSHMTTTSHIKAVLTSIMKTEGFNGARIRSSKRIRRKTNIQAPQVNS
ncbi:hypothetical protein E4U31_000808, partial [Claviceps sp. LM219 group G6]